MIFRKASPFPKSIFANVAYGLRVGGLATGRGELEARVEASLQAAGLWDEVKDRLEAPALALSGGQQQRLCIARALAVRPEILLLDEPAAALDPIGTQRLEELIHRLKSTYTIVIVTHNMQQAARISDRTAVFWLGRLVEYDRTDRIFTAPSQRITEDYVTGSDSDRSLRRVTAPTPQAAHGAARRERRGAVGSPQADAGGLGRSPI